MGKSKGPSSMLANFGTMLGKAKGGSTLDNIYRSEGGFLKQLIIFHMYLVKLEHLLITVLQLATVVV